MALFPALDTDHADFSAESALRFPLGAASPLWFAFASAAGAGVAYWWMTRWTRQPANLEALDWFSPKAAEAPTTAAVPAIVAQPAVEAPVETPVEAAVEPIEAAADAVVETVAALAEPVNEAVEDTADVAIAAADDLTRLVGIGPKLAERLGDLGVRSFKDIAAWSEEDLASFDKELDLKGRAVRDAWVAQARRFAEG